MCAEIKKKRILQINTLASLMCKRDYTKLHPTYAWPGHKMVGVAN